MCQVLAAGITFGKRLLYETQLMFERPTRALFLPKTADLGRVADVSNL